MENKGVNVYAAIIAMVLTGILIGIWQGFWIAFIKIPPFITTLSGMLVFRGLSNVVLQGMTVSLKSETFIKIFGGGANCYFRIFSTMKDLILPVLLLVLSFVWLILPFS